MSHYISITAMVICEADMEKEKQRTCMDDHESWLKESYTRTLQVYDFSMVQNSNDDTYENDKGSDVTLIKHSIIIFIIRTVIQASNQ